MLNQERETKKIFKTKKTKYPGQILRIEKNTFLQFILRGNIEGEREVEAKSYPGLKSSEMGHYCYQKY